jgi:hypothetical protein
MTSSLDSGLYPAGASPVLVAIAETTERVISRLFGTPGGDSVIRLGAAKDTDPHTRTITAIMLMLGYFSLAFQAILTMILLAMSGDVFFGKEGREIGAKIGGVITSYFVGGFCAVLFYYYCSRLALRASDSLRRDSWTAMAWPRFWQISLVQISVVSATAAIAFL